MKPRVYDILRRAVEEGCAYGAGRAFKHTATPSAEQIRGEVEAAVMDAICEVFEFDEEENA